MSKPGSYVCARETLRKQGAMQKQPDYWLRNIQGKGTGLMYETREVGIAL